MWQPAPPGRALARVRPDPGQLAVAGPPPALAQPPPVGLRLRRSTPERVVVTRHVPAHAAGGLGFAEAARNFRGGMTALTTGFAAVGAGLRSTAVAARTAEQELRRLSEQLPEPHAFKPDLDLRCRVRRCTLTPEEHGLW